MDARIAAASHFLDLGNCFPIAFSQAVIHAIQKLTFGFRLLLTCLYAIILNCLLHALRRQKIIRIHIDNRSKIPANPRQSIKLIETIFMLEFAAQRLHHPKTHDIF